MRRAGSFYVFLVLLVLVGGFFLARDWHEERLIVAYLQNNGLKGVPVSKQTAVRVSDTVRRDFEVDERKWTRLKMDRRPFLREDTGFLLEAREGLCGEGTRVIVNLLLELGFDATRVVLYDRQLNPIHTLVSIVIDGEEYFIDSINSPDDFNNYLRDHQFSAKSFNLISHQEDIIDLRKEIAAKKSRGSEPELEPFWLYSYEATPVTKVARLMGWQLRAFNHSRPPRLLSALAEKPNLVLAIAWTVCLIAVYVALWMLLHFLRKRRLQKGGGSDPVRGDNR
jgi:hypothetical protein